jgi:hypothetical protein
LRPEVPHLIADRRICQRKDDRHGLALNVTILKAVLVDPLLLNAKK